MRGSLRIGEMEGRECNENIFEEENGIAGDDRETINLERGCEICGENGRVFNMEEGSREEYSSYVKFSSR